jgi:predicted DCC family thiol-disulfide oxidoreductase YuxK
MRGIDDMAAGDPAAARVIVLFDGVCNFCDGLVRFLIRHDPSGRLRFCAMQSNAGRTLLASRGFDPDALDTFVVLDGPRNRARGDAVLAIARVIDAPWSWLAAGRILPRPLRDALYRIVANNRYAWFGRRDSCLVPTPEIRSRFL